MPFISTTGQMNISTCVRSFIRQKSLTFHSGQSGFKRTYFQKTRTLIFQKSSSEALAYIEILPRIGNVGKKFVCRILADLRTKFRPNFDSRSKRKASSHKFRFLLQGRRLESQGVHFAPASEGKGIYTHIPLIYATVPRSKYE